MASTRLAPGYLKMTYTGVLFPHHMTIPVKYDGTPSVGSMPNVLNKGGGSIAADLGLALLLDAIKVFFHTTVHFGLVEAHAVDATSGLDTFLFSWDAAKVGTGSAATIATSQAIWTLKTVNGGLYRLYLMETTEGPGSRIVLPSGNADIDDVTAAYTDDASIAYGRGNAFPFVGVSFITKLNDKLRKQQGLA